MNNIVKTGSKYNVYGEDLQTFKKLPALFYKLKFSELSGLFLETINDLSVNEKIYGDTPQKVQKVLNTFESIDRNLGVILSGEKGCGKSLFIKELSIKAKEKDIPVIIVSEMLPDLPDFISSIEQEAIIIFDEFEKTFSNDNKNGATDQEQLLSLFDGIDCGKKLFVISCNETNKLSEYFLNRPR